MENVRASTSRVMYTPRTPRMRERERFNLSTRLEENEEIDISGLEALVGLTWNVYAISALFGLQRDDVHLKLYSKKLREEIASTLSRENVTYDAKFSLMEEIVSRPYHQNHPAIKIEVLAKTNGGGEADTERHIYKAILLSWRVTQIEQDMQNCVKLPLLLCRGTRSCMDAVHAIVGRMFDCLVVALPANGDDLSWLIPIIIMSTNREDQPAISGEIQMEYTVPELPVTDTIIVKFHTSDLRKILMAIVMDQDDNLSLDHEHVEKFYEVLHKQMLIVGDMQLGLCTLHRIILPGITIMENRMKVMSVEIMNRILLYLNEKAFDTFHAVNIDV
ncbi:hypothetical protein DMN91_001489 [Ooceraea biroi]|uniref:Centromere protein L n=2 Tax=Ooceraea biroi TaxID=2015173 RepID=A0A3L8DYN7_OOCBI|nr:centromere protein L isoform X2 [Ooceraea biroi]RLU25333.1 hypothetical protein DMN91_001489 [Ooceraea biroi]